MNSFVMGDSVNPAKSFAGLVLAGGRSSRMGQDKSQLELNGKTLLQRAVTLLNNTGATELLVSAHSELALASPSFDEVDLQVVTDRFKNKGPLAGIDAAMSKTELPLLIIPVDMPLLTSTQLRNIVDASFSAEPGTDNAVCYQDHILPLFLPNTELLRDDLTHRLTSSVSDKKSLSIRRFIQQIALHELSTDDLPNNCLSNVNDPAQWQQAVGYIEKQRFIKS